MSFKIYFKAFLDLFFPDNCLCCGEKLLYEEKGVCLECLYQLPKTNNYKESNSRIEIMMAGRFPFQRIVTFCLFTKGGMLQPLIHALKYKGRKDIGFSLGRLYGLDLMESGFLNNIDFIVPVPLHPHKLKKRGYNQACVIAQGLSEAVDIPISTDNLIRVIDNPTQTKRGKGQRWDNVKGIFYLKDPECFAQKHILLVDDVITTGSTIEACVSALRQGVDIKISIAALGEVF